MIIYNRCCPVCRVYGDHRQINKDVWQNEECKHVFMVSENESN